MKTTPADQGIAAAKADNAAELSDELDPRYAFQTMSSELISKFASGEYDFAFYLRFELANRGQNINGNWIGFDAAAAEHKIYT